MTVQIHQLKRIFDFIALLQSKTSGTMQSKTSGTKMIPTSHRLVEILAKEGKKELESDQWFILPLPDNLKKDEYIEQYRNFIDVLHPSLSRDAFAADFYHNKRPRQSTYDYVTATFEHLLQKNQIRLYKKHYVLMNFNSSPEQRLRGILENSSSDWPPKWSLMAICRFYMSYFKEGQDPILVESNVVAAVSPDDGQHYIQRANNTSAVLSTIVGCGEATIIVPDEEDADTSIVPKIPTSIILAELYRRNNFVAHTLRFERNRFRCLQRMDEMTDKRKKDFLALVRDGTTALIKEISPNSTVEDIQLIQSLIAGQNTDLEILHSKAIQEKIRSQKPLERRAQLSFLTRLSTRKRISSLLGSSINYREWTAARRHAIDPGVGEAVVKSLHRRCQFSHETLKTFFDFLVGHIQRTSYGTKLLSILDGKVERIEAIKTTATFERIFTLYMNDVINSNLREVVEGEEKEGHDQNDVAFKEDSDSSDEESLTCDNKDGGGSTIDCDGDEICGDWMANAAYCDMRNRCGQYCLKEVHHEGRHKYTPSGFLSRTTVRSLLTLLTTGEIKSLAGLDDEDVEKGRNNWIRLRAVVTKISDLLANDKTNGSNVLFDNVTTMKNIDEAEDFYTTGFIRHVKNKANSDFICCCLPCGFRSSDDNIQCPIIESQGKHPKGICADCMATFKIFPRIESGLDLVKQLNLDGALLLTNKFAQCEILDLFHELQETKQNLKDYRAHLILKFDESEAEKELISNLKPNQALVISDWKMKILSAFFRERQQDFFGKRGTGLIGFMVVFNDPGEAKKDTKNVQFHFMLTDDTTQDATSVNAAKCYIYNEILPSHIDEVHFRADGAGCFSSNVTKASIVHWSDWTGGRVKEISNIQSPAGAGKTNLDGLFGVLQRILRDAVKRGHDYYDSVTILKALESSTPIKASTYHIFEPRRENILGTKIKKLSKHYRIVLCDGGIKLYKHSRWSIGEFVPNSQIIDAWVINTEGENNEGEHDREAALSSEEIALSSLPSAPAYQILATTGRNGASLSSYTQKSSEERREKIKADRVDAQIDKINRKVNINTHALLSKGVFPCTILNDAMHQCTCTFFNQANLDTHLQQGEHKFPSLSGMAQAALMASSSKGLLSLGSFMNRSSAVAFNQEATSAEAINDSEFPIDDEWCKDGCYNKPPRKNVRRMTATLKNDLLTIFDDGMINPSAKLSAQATLKKLSLMTEEGWPKYSRLPNNLNGPLPDSDQIKNFFSQLSAKRRKQGQASEKNDESESSINYSKFTTKNLEDKCGDRGLPKAGFALLIKIISLSDYLLEDGPEKGIDDSAYFHMTANQIKDRLAKRDIDVSTNKKMLVTALRLHDQFLQAAQEIQYLMND